MPPLEQDLLSIIQLHGKEVNTIVDLLAVVFEVGPIQIINCQDGKPRKKRNVTLIDDSYKVVTLGLWPDFTERLNGLEGHAIIFQNLQLREYQAKLMLSTTTNTIITVESADDGVNYLNEWFRSEGCSHDYEELRTGDAQ